MYIYICIAASWRSVADHLKTHPHCEDAFVKNRPNRRRRISRRRRILKLGEDALEGTDALGGDRRIGWRRRTAKTHWVAQTHCEDTLDGRRCIAKTHWVGGDALGRRKRIGVAKTASTVQVGADALRSRFHDIAATLRVLGQLHMHDSHDS